MLARTSDLISPQGLHEDRETINLYAMPNLNAMYTSDDIAKTAWAGEYPQCAVCGKTRSFSFEVHHEPPRSKGSLLLMTDMGQFVVKPTLVLLCHDCHLARHSRGTLSFRWEWNDADYETRFWQGKFFYEDLFAEHDQRFWDYGKAYVSVDDIEWRLFG